MTELTVSRLLSLPVKSPDGKTWGRVQDLRIGHTSARPVVDCLMLRSRRGRTSTVPWSFVQLPTAGRPWVTVTIDPADDTAPSSALWLRRDVLDSQVVDLTGCRLSRVSEILLTTVDGHAARPFAVDLGIGALASRVGLGLLGRRMGRVLVTWDDLYLASQGGHRGELAVSADRLQRLDAAAVAEIVARLRIDQASEILQTVEPASAAGALAVSHHDLRHRLVQSLPLSRRAAVIRAAPGTVAHDLEVLAQSPLPAGRRSRRTAGWRVRRPGHPPR